MNRLRYNNAIFACYVNSARDNCNSAEFVNNLLHPISTAFVEHVWMSIRFGYEVVSGYNESSSSFWTFYVLPRLNKGKWTAASQQHKVGQSTVSDLVIVRQLERVFVDRMSSLRNDVNRLGSWMRCWNLVTSWAEFDFRLRILSLTIILSLNGNKVMT